MENKVLTNQTGVMISVGCDIDTITELVYFVFDLIDRSYGCHVYEKKQKIADFKPLI